MRRLLKLLLFSLFFAQTYIAPLIAGPLEDADVAIQKGDYATGVRLLRPLAEQGDATAQNALGLLYTNGTGVPQNYVEAVRWFRKAAEQDLAVAQANLGWAYANGKGVEQDDMEALKWIRRGADKGDAYARTLLAFMYSRGRGVKQDLSSAYRWSNLAVAQGFEQAKALVIGIVPLMTPEQLAEARKQDAFYRRYASLRQFNAKAGEIQSDPNRVEELKKIFAQSGYRGPKGEAEMEYIHAIQFVDENTGFALDFNGNFHETHDGGLTWSQKPMPVQPDLKEKLSEKLTKPFFRSPEFLAMHFADKEFGMAVSRLNALVTRDGGTTWVVVPRPAKEELRALWCTKNRTCFLGGSPQDVIYVLRDGDKQWMRQKSQAGCCLYSLQFWDDRKGWAVSHSGSIIRTEDGGLKWQRVFFDRSQSFWAIHFPTDQLGFVVGANGSLMRTSDGGRNWENLSSKIQIPKGVTREALRFQAVKFADEKRGWIAGRYGIIFTTSDGGDSWSVAAFVGAQRDQSLLTIYSLDTTHEKVWAAGNGGNINLSLDDGRDWFPVHGVQFELLEHMQRAVDQLTGKNGGQRK